jgi:hypothetical protein
MCHKGKRDLHVDSMLGIASIIYHSKVLYARRLYYRKRSPKKTSTITPGASSPCCAAGILFQSAC